MNDLVIITSQGRGRAPDFEIAFAVCEAIAGGMTLRAYCAAHPEISETEFRQWVQADEQIARMHSVARELQAHSLFDEVVDTARSAPSDAMPKVAKARLVVDALRWASGKLSPRQYGDRSLPTSGVAIQINTTLALEDGKPGGQEVATKGYSLTAAIPLEIVPPAENDPAPEEAKPLRKKGGKRKGRALDG